MPRLLLAALPVATLLVGSLLAADDKEKKDKDTAKPTAVTITKVDAKKGEITIKYTDDKRQEHKKTFKLTKDVRMFDETGRVVAIDVFESGNQALILEEEGKLKELRRPATAHHGHRLSDAMSTLFEMTEYDTVYVDEVQRIYDMLRKLDTAKNGKIDLDALKAARDRIVEKRVQELLTRLDADKDGKISKEEAKGLIKEDFDKIDLNKDGFIDRDELLKAAKGKPPTHSKPSEPEKK